MNPRSWWQNCPTNPALRRRMCDSDKLADSLDPIPVDALAVRDLIGRLRIDDKDGVENVLDIVREIGGSTAQPLPFVASSRLATLPLRDRMYTVVRTLDIFAEGAVNVTGVVDVQVLSMLGRTTPVKAWLATALALTVRAQLDI